MAFHEERMDISAAVHSENLLVLYIQSHFLGDYTLVSAIREAQEGLRILVIDESTATLSVRISLPPIHPGAKFSLTQECDAPG